MSAADKPEAMAVRMADELDRYGFAFAAGLLRAQYAELSALRALIDAHNAGYAEACEARKRSSGVQAGACYSYERMTVPRCCPDCPRLDMIDVAGIDAVARGG